MQPKLFATKSFQSALRLLKHFACIISNKPPYKTQSKKQIKNTVLLLRYFIPTTKHKLHKTKNSEACTNLSKLNNSSQLVLGIYWPGVAHKIKITSAQAMVIIVEYFKIIVFKPKYYCRRLHRLSQIFFSINFIITRT